MKGITLQTESNGLSVITIDPTNLDPRYSPLVTGLLSLLQSDVEATERTGSRSADAAPKRSRDDSGSHPIHARSMITDYEFNALRPEQQIEHLMSTTFTEVIDWLERGRKDGLFKATELSQALYQIARQNAAHRRALDPLPVLPPVASLRLHELAIDDLPKILAQTNDVAVADQIQELTQTRLRRQPRMRQALFDIARQAVAYRQELTAAV